MTYKPTDEFRPFSNGTEFLMWLERNCKRGHKGCRRYNPNAESSRHGCPIEVALAMGTITGTIPARIALRGGFLAPGPNGTLVDARAPGVIGECPEYRGGDDPPDRPRRGPKPPEGQEDLLDPRNQPAPEAAVEETVLMPTDEGGSRMSDWKQHHAGEGR